MTFNQGEARRVRGLCVSLYVYIDRPLDISVRKQMKEPRLLELDMLGWSGLSSSLVMELEVEIVGGWRRHVCKNINASYREFQWGIESSRRINQ